MHPTPVPIEVRKKSGEWRVGRDRRWETEESVEEMGGGGEENGERFACEFVILTYLVDLTASTFYDGRAFHRLCIVDPQTW